MAQRRRTGRWAILAMALALGLGAVVFGDATLQRVSLLLTRNPVPATPVEIAKGAALFDQNCTGCHGAAGQRGPDPATPDLTGLNRPASVLAMRITYGVGNGMPGWDGVLSPQDIWQLVTYAESLQQGGGGGWRRW